MISSLLHLVGLRPRVYYTLTNFRGGGEAKAPPPQYANALIYLDEHRIYRYIPYYTIIVSVAKKTRLISEIKCITFLENTRFKIQT